MVMYINVTINVDNNLCNTKNKKNKKKCNFHPKIDKYVTKEIYKSKKKEKVKNIIGIVN